jgi:hypothetical protein
LDHFNFIPALENFFVDRPLNLGLLGSSGGLITGVHRRLGARFNRSADLTVAAEPIIQRRMMLVVKLSQALIILNDQEHDRDKSVRVVQSIGL